MSKKARDLLPPDGPPPVKPEDVRPADDDLEVEVETRKIGIRRVTALNFADRLMTRTRWRPAGNSRRFWRQIEADDPFKKKPARPTDAPLDVYPAQRIDRVEGSMPKPQPEVAKAYPPAPQASEAPPRPMREAPRPTPRPAPPPPVEPVHTPEPRAVAAPTSVVPEPEPEPAPAPQQMPRHLPPKAPPPGGGGGNSRTGRQRMPSRASQQAVYGKGGKTAAQIREEKLKARTVAKETKPQPAVKQRSVDSYREMLQNLAFSQEVYERGEEAPEVPVPDDKAGGVPAKVKGEVKRRKKRTRAESKAAPTAATPAPAPAPVPPPQPAAPVDRTPPKVTKPKADAPIDRTPKGAGNNANLDDLFGGGGDRVRIGRRAKPSEPKEEEEGES